jgi:membrane protease YdiL (CAAX protease family)
MLEPVGALLPRTEGERRLFAALAVTAGICEEVLFRGFLLFYLQEVFPGLEVAGAVAVSSIVFGLAHLYQGAVGTLMTGLFGAAMAILYVVSGSLVLPILLHALLDLRILLVYRPEEGDEGA